MAKKGSRRLFSTQGKLIALGVVGLIVVAAVATTLFGDYAGLRIAPGLKFKILGPKTLQVGQTATVTWDASTVNAIKHPYEKIEYCRGGLLKRKCAVLASAAHNNGKTVVRVPASLPAGKGYLKLTARDPKYKLLWLLSSTLPVSVQAAESGSGGSGGGSGGGGTSATPTATSTATPTATPTSTSTATPSPSPTPTSEPPDSRVQCSGDSPTVIFSAQQETGIPYVHDGPGAVSGWYRVEVVGGRSWTNNAANEAKARYHGSNFMAVQDEPVSFGPDGRVNNSKKLYFSSLWLDPPQLNRKQRVGEAALGLDQILQLARGDVLTFVVDGIKGQFGVYGGDLEVRICPAPAPTPRPDPCDENIRLSFFSRLLRAATGQSVSRSVVPPCPTPTPSASPTPTPIVCIQASCSTGKPTCNKGCHIFCPGDYERIRCINIEVSKPPTCYYNDNTRIFAQCVPDSID